MMFRPSFPHPFVLGRYHSSVFPDILASLARSNLHWTRHTASPTRNIPCNLLAAHRQRYKGRSSWEHSTGYCTNTRTHLPRRGLAITPSSSPQPIKQWISYPHTLVGVNSNSASQIFPILVSPPVHTHTIYSATAYPYISHYNPPGFQPLCQFESSTLPDPASCV